MFFIVYYDGDPLFLAWSQSKGWNTSVAWGGLGFVVMCMLL